ncbi:MAG: hypothetical protein WBW04_14555 [Nitrolancea sp.]
MRRGHSFQPVFAIVLIFALFASIAIDLPASAGAAPSAPPDQVYFPETGHYLSYGFLDYWRLHGDLAQFGYPITDELTDPGSGYTEQYFERAVFEWHPDAPSGWQIQLRRLGADTASNRLNEPPFTANDQRDDGCSYFSQTGHQICGHFLNYWESNGGLDSYGYPLSDAFTEQDFTVQYFERARFEWHPENAGTPYAVLLGLLGRDAAARDNVDQRPQPPSTDVPQYAPELFNNGALNYNVTVTFHAQQDPDWCDPADVQTWLDSTGVTLSGSSDSDIQSGIWAFEISHNDGFSLAEWHASPYAVAAALNAFGATEPIGDAAFDDIYSAGQVISRSLAVYGQPVIALVDDGSHYVLVTGVELGPGGIDTPPKSVTVYDPWTISADRGNYPAMGQGTVWDWVTFSTRFNRDSTIDPGIWSGKWTLIAAGLPLEQ